MLENVGTDIAMGNAADEVKKKADAICKSVDEDGVYFYCLENKLIKTGGKKFRVLCTDKGKEITGGYINGNG